MVEAVYKEAKEIFGKDFLLAGILPAGMLLFAISWYELGWSSFRSLVGGWVSSKTEFTTGALTSVAALLITALILFSLREPALDLLRYLPYSFLRGVREKLRAYQLRKLYAIEEELERVEWKYTIALWYKQNFAAGKYTPVFISNKSSDEAVLASARARREVAGVLSAKLINLGIDQADALITGLGALHTFIARNATLPLSISAEVDEWNKLLKSSPRMTFLFEALEAGILPQFIDVFERKAGFPTRRWIQPTALGNEIAALDDYSESRYGIETSALWPRLREVIPTRSREEVRTVELNIEILVNLLISSLGLFLLILTTSLWRTYVAFQNGDGRLDWRTISFLLVASLLSVLFYRGAAYATSMFRHKLTSLIDVYSLLLLYSMGYRPSTEGQKYAILQGLKECFANGKRLGPATGLQCPSSFKEGDKT